MKLFNPTFPNPSFSDFLIFTLMVGAIWFIQRFVLKFMMEKWTLKLKEKEHHFQYELFRHYLLPLRYTFILSGIYFALSYIIGFNLWDISTANKVFHSSLIGFLFLGIYRLLSFYAEHPDQWTLFTKGRTNQAIFPFLCRFGKVAVVFMGITVISTQWGYNMNGFIAGLGIGGIALALGAKDVLSNIFGGTAVVLDKPFSIGDVISTEDKRLQGIVEDINFRSTRLKTFDKEIIYIPNALLANQPIYNYSRRDRRRVRFQLGMSLQTPGYKIRNVMDDIKTAILDHEGVDSENFTVSFDEYTQTSLNLLIVYFTNSAEYDIYTKTKEEINFLVMNILMNHDVSLAPAVQHMNYNRNVLQ